MLPSSRPPPPRGRGAAYNPPTRFDPLYVEEDPELPSETTRRIPTRFFRDHSRSVLARNDSPDIPFTFSLNPYRGCEHGCIYCYARPSHEYLGFSAGIDFETNILVKMDAPALLERTFERRSWTPQVVSLSGNTDPYQPVERKLGLTRQCLEVFLQYRNPVSVITKNHLVTRDLDVLYELARRNLVRVTISVTSLRAEIIQVMEPRSARPELRLKTIEELAARGVPVGVSIAPIIPGLTDEEMPAILKEAVRCGATSAFYQVVRLPGAVRELFIEWLGREFPGKAAKVANRMKTLHGPEMRDGRFGKRMKGEGEWANVLDALFRTTCRRVGLKNTPALSTTAFRRLRAGQAELF